MLKLWISYILYWMGNMKMDKRAIWKPFGVCIKTLNRITFPLQQDTNGMICFDPSIKTDNLGDQIIMYYCQKVLADLFPERRIIHIGTHSLPSREEQRLAKHTKYKIVCGTNLLTSHIEHHWRWILPDGIRQKMNYRNVILLGVGWGEYQDECSDYSWMVYRCMLNPNVLHSVRDRYTQEKLYQAGFENVINTGCPTTWALTPELCCDIPTQKAKNVVTTITDYRRDPQRDQTMLEILSRNYEHIDLWLQGRQDDEYLKTLKVPENLTTIPASLEAYETVLRKGGVDYVGTRLHAGIHALNHKVRSIILAVDNRATEMGRDVKLPVIQREQIEDELEDYINSDFKTEISIDQEKIECFKEQFRR